MFEKKLIKTLGVFLVLGFVFVTQSFSATIDPVELPENKVDVTVISKNDDGTYNYNISGLIGPIQGTGSIDNFNNTWWHSVQVGGDKFGIDWADGTQIQLIPVSNPDGGDSLVYYQFKLEAKIAANNTEPIQIFEDGNFGNGQVFVNSSVNFQALRNSYDLIQADPCLGPNPPDTCQINMTPPTDCSTNPNQAGCPGYVVQPSVPSDCATNPNQPNCQVQITPRDCNAYPNQPGCSGNGGNNNGGGGYLPTPVIASVPTSAGCGDWSGITDMDQFVTCIAEWGGRANLFIIGAGVLSSLFLLPIAGYMYASGNPGNIEKASEIITSWMWGIILLLIAGFIINIIGNDLFGVS